MPATDTDLVTGYWTLRNDVAAVPVERDLVLVEGTDAESFLQGQLSQDMATLVVTGPAWSLLLQPTGKVTAWVRVARLGAERFVLDVEGGFGADVVARLERFKIRVKVTITQLEGWKALSVRGPNLAAARLDTANAELIVPADWPGSPGADLFGPLLEVPEGVPVVAAGSLEMLRVECGVPRMGTELDEHTIPAEAGAWIIESSVSFTKGCYTGQELVARIDRGGNVPRQLRLVVLADGVALADVAVGASITAGDDDKVVGALTSVVRSPARDAVIGLAFVGRAVEPRASVIVHGMNGAPLEATVESPSCHPTDVTHYEVLGMRTTASAVELRQAYLQLARSSHPDLEPDPSRRSAAEDRMRSINEAWSVLGDPQRRRAYDDELSVARRTSRPANSPSPDFVPLDDDDTDYAALLDDTPVEGTEVPRVLQLLPVVLLGIAAGSLCLGLVTSFGPFVGLGVVCLVLALLAFLAAPALAVMQSHAQDPG